MTVDWSVFAVYLAVVSETVLGGRKGLAGPWGECLGGGATVSGEGRIRCKAGLSGGG